LSASRRLLFSFLTIRFVAGFREQANDALSPEEYPTQEGGGRRSSKLERLFTSVSVVAGGRKAILGKPVRELLPNSEKVHGSFARFFSSASARPARRAHTGPEP
jgi:hypothetical protein